MPCQVPSPSDPSEIGIVSEGPISTDLTWAGMSSGPSSECRQKDGSSRTASLNQVSRSVLTSGLAFSFSASEAEVCWISRCRSPTPSSLTSGSWEAISSPIR